MKLLFTVVCAAICTFYATSGATTQWYTEQWTEVQGLEAQKRPALAQKVIDKIFDQAIKDSNYPEMLCALDKQRRLKASINWNSITPFTDSMRRLEHLFPYYTPKIAYYIQMVAWLRDVKTHARSEDTTGYFYALPLNEWSIPQKFKATERYIGMALAYADSIKNEAPGEYAKLFYPEKEMLMPSRNLYIWARRAVIMSLGNDYNDYGYKFDNKITDRINDELLAATIDNPYLFIDVYLADRRLRDARYIKNDAYPAILDSLIARFPNHPAIVWPETEKLKHYENNSDSVSYSDIDRQLNQLIARFPDSKFISHVHEYKQRLHAKSGSITTPDQIYPDKKTSLKISYSNIDHLYFAIYRLPDSTNLSSQNMSEKVVTDYMKKGHPVVSKSLKLKPELHVYKEAAIEVELKKMGKYMLVCRDQKDSILSTNYFSVSRVGAFYRKSIRGVEVYAADFETGKPFKNVDVAMEATVNKQTDRFTKHTSAEGYSVLLSPEMVSNDPSLQLTVKVDGDFYTVPTIFDVYKQTYSQTENHRTVKIYTDRSRYASRDTVFFKAYMYEKADSLWRVCKGIDNWFSLQSSNHKKLATSSKLTSDSFGGYNGYFILDGSPISGSYHICDNFNNQSGYFHVGDFKLPTLYGQIETDKNDYSFGDTVNCKGSVFSYAGFPVEGVTVKYTVNRYPNRDLLSYYATMFDNETITEAKTTTNSDGNFTISFAATKPEEVKNYKTALRYEITATITDARGETQELRKTIYLGEYKYAFRFRSKLPGEIDRNSGFKPNIDAVFNHGKKIEGEKGHYRIEDQDSNNIILEGRFVSGEPVAIEWAKLECKKYKIIMNSDYTSESIEWFTIYDSRDTRMPKGVDRLFIVPNKECASDGSISFFFGTTANKQYAAVELFDGDSLVWASNMMFEKGLRKYTIPYPEHRPDNVYLHITSIYEGKIYNYEQNYTLRKAAPSQINLKIVSLRETSTPGAEEDIAVEVKDEHGKGVEASVLISIYDKATNNYYQNIFRELSRTFSLKTPNISSIASCFDTSSKYFNFERLNDVWNSDKVTIGYATDVAVCSDILSIGSGNTTKAVERKSFHRTAAFVTDLVTNADGYASTTFTLPDGLTTYNVQAVAVAKDAQSAVASSEIVAKKELMAIANYPQYLRVGDHAKLSIQARNLGDKELDATLTLTAESQKNNNTEKFTLHLPANSSQTVSWNIDVPQGASEIRLTADLDGKSHRDIEKRTIPVIEAKEHFTTGKSGVVQNGSVELNLREIVRGGENEKLSIKVSSAQTAIVASLPLVLEPNPTSLIDILNNWYINGVGHVISRRYDRIIDMWVKDEEDANVIDRNIPLTSISASETPWRLNENAIDRGKALQEIKDSQTTYDRSKRIVSSLSTYQNYDGGYPWFRGMPSSPYITMMLLDRYNALFDCGYFSGSAKFTFYSGAVRYIDEDMMKIYKNRENHKKLPSDALDYLYVRSALLRYKFDDEQHSKMWNYFMERAQQEWRSYKIADIAKVAMVMRQIDPQYNIDEYLDCLAEYAVPGKSFGIYFPNAVMPFRGIIESELRAHAIMLRLFDTSERYSHLSEGIAQWLMSQRTNQQWRNSTTTTDVVWAIVNHYEIVDKKVNHERGGYRINVDNEYIIAQTPLRGCEIDTKAVMEGKLSNITVTATGASPCFIDVSYSRDLPLVDTKADGNGFKIVRTLFREKVGSGEELIDENTQLKPGDVVIARYYIQNDENRSFVVVKALRSGAFEPINNISGYSYDGGYYREVKDSHTNYFFYTLPEGDNVIEDRFHVWYTGKFSDGLAKVQSLMAPSYSANTPAGILNVTQ